MRVVSLACSNTEIVCALGCADLLVGVDDHSDHPADVVGRLPRLGPDLEPNLDRVAALQPDLVLASLTVPGHERVIERLRAARLEYLAPEPESLEDVFRDIEAIGRRLGVEDRANRLVSDLRRELDPPPGAEAHAPRSAPAVDPTRSTSMAPATTAAARPSILVQWWPKPVIAPGRRSWVHDLIERAGGSSPLGGEDTKSRPLTDREVLDLAPDAFVLSWCGVPFAKYRPDVIYGNATWRDLEALARRQVHCIPEAFLGRPSPRLVDGFRALRRVVESAARPVAD
ncbi:MAG TPA: helical backbone metal receptor [Thermoanaerobaculia bacterium]|nr:helical backbone metal receptor [Thermoanaerobaculia bacterium]